MSKSRESPTTALDELTAEMASPRIAASAQEAMHPETEGMERKLILVREDRFHSYACSWCGCRFPEIDISIRATLVQTPLLLEAQRETRFAEHVCSDRPHITH